MSLIRYTNGVLGHRRVARLLAGAGFLTAVSTMYLRSRMGNGEVTWALATAGATAALALIGLGWLGFGWSRRRRFASIFEGGGAPSFAACGALGLVVAGYAGSWLLRVVTRSPVAAGWSALLVRWRAFPFSERVFAVAVQPWSPRRRMATVALLGVAATANWAVWPSSTDHWIVMQWVLFAGAVGASVVAFSPGRRTAHRGEPPRSVGTSVASAQETPAAA